LFALLAVSLLAVACKEKGNAPSTAAAGPAAVAKPAPESFRVAFETSKGNFTVQMRLPATAASTTITLHNDLGQLVWQQNLGTVSGAVQRTMALENKLPAGLYTLTIQRSDIKLNQNHDCFGFTLRSLDRMVFL
jgi:hypothetical protein